MLIAFYPSRYGHPYIHHLYSGNDINAIYFSCNTGIAIIHFVMVYTIHDATSFLNYYSHLSSAYQHIYFFFVSVALIASFDKYAKDKLRGNYTSISISIFLPNCILGISTGRFVRVNKAKRKLFPGSKYRENQVRMSEPDAFRYFVDVSI